MDNKIKVALVEDDVFIAESLKFSLEDLGYEVAFVAYSYSEAVEGINSTPFDLILLDINLHEQHYSGLDIAQKVLTEHKKPFIFVTAYSDKDTITKAVKLKPSAYLVKPINEGSLFAAIQTAIQNFDLQTPAHLPHQESEELSHFFTKIGNKIIKIEWAEVYALVASKNYVNFITSQDHYGYPIRSSLQQAITKIVPTSLREDYLQINRSTIIHKSIITGIDSKNILTTKGEFEIGASYFTDIKKYLNLL